ncbi:pumilio homolog 2-like [Phoenix dactylifera]|uniref:Pumilio homolog 2-like n=1 Tax=Phoenix dactylifera TaxID=42345 RepID=A0A8B7BNQ2_PHODC|nr:pumilio homolog 2-like [Phoenix dactylifera]
MRLGIQEDKEMEMLLDEINYATSPHPHHHHHDDARAGNDDARRIPHVHPIHDMNGSAADACPSPSHALVDGRGHGYGYGAGHACVSPPHLVSEGSSSSSSSLSGTLSPAGEDGARRSSAGEDWMMEELGLVGGLRSMSIGDDREAPLGFPPKPKPALALANNAISPYLFRTNYGSDLVPGGAVDDAYGARRRSVLFFDVDERLYGYGPQQHCSVDANRLESWMETHRLDSPASYSNGLCTAPENFLWREEAIRADGAFGANSCYRGSRGLGFPSSFLQSLQSGVALGQDLNAWNSLSPHHLMLSKQVHSLPYSWAPQSQFLARNLRNVEPFGCENSLIIQEKGLHYVGNQCHCPLEERKRLQLDDRMYLRGIRVANVDSVPDVHQPELGHSPSLPLKYDDLMGIEGYVYSIAKDQHGCRYLQHKFDEGSLQVDVIFNGIIDHVVELMVDPFGNYLMQKLLDVCSEEQMTRIILMLTEDAEELVRISLNIHGTRAVQKLIETLKSRQQIALVISALRPGFLDLIKDLNGNHVVQRCLQCLTVEDNKFIFDAATKHCVDIATHQHGCCVLQRCISHSTGEHWMKLVAEISTNGLKLAQDDFGNYVVQYILDLKSPLVIANLVSQFEGNYVQLSMQKFSSHVVEKCLKVFGEDDQATIILELLSVSQFEQLLQHPYANYVIQSALQNTKGSLHATLVEAIHPHAAILRTSPYCKRIFSRALPKK